MKIVTYVFLFILGSLFGSFFCKVGLKLPLNDSIFDESKCDKCNHKFKFSERIPILSYIINFGKCKYCHEKLNQITIVSELLTGILFVISYMSFKNVYPENINILFSIIFVSSLVLIIISDIKYMIIPDEILIFFSIVLIPIKLYIYYLTNINVSIMDIGYELIFILLDGLIVFSIMYLIKKIGKIIFKTDSMGGGDVKMMAFVSFIMGWKMSIVVIFLASFLALPLSIINMYKNKEHTIAFGPYLSVATLILFLSKIDFTTIINFIL